MAMGNHQDIDDPGLASLAITCQTFVISSIYHRLGLNYRIIQRKGVEIPILL